MGKDDDFIAASSQAAKADMSKWPEWMRQTGFKTFYSDIHGIPKNSTGGQPAKNPESTEGTVLKEGRTEQHPSE